MQELDPGKFDWPLPEAGSDAENALEAGEALQVAAEEIRHTLQSLDQSAQTEFIDLLARCFEDSPAPSQSVSAIERLLNRTGVSEFVDASLKQPDAFARCWLLAGLSKPLADCLIDGGWRGFYQLTPAELAEPVSAAEVMAENRRSVESGRQPRHALRETHRVLMLRVVYHEVALAWDLEAVAQEISALADGALEFALEIARAEVARKRSLQGGEGFRFCVIAMGKLGAQELNYSSDIDLIFVHAGEPPSPETSRPLTGQQYATRLAETLIPLLDERTEHGHVFRVDTRLRPEGKRGSLTRGLESTLKYYFSFGSTWERQALIKARPCAGDLELGEELLENLQGWIYRKYLTVEEIHSLKEQKRRIEKRTDDRDETFRDVKTGFGGIRDIEFVTQFLQLLNGGRIPEVRSRGTLEALRALAKQGVLRPREATELADGYRFLRAVEHRLQLREGAQTHNLPADPAGLVRIGLSMGFRGNRRADAARILVNELRAHTLRTRGLLIRLFAGLFESHPSPAESRLVLDPDPDPVAAMAVLSQYGFRDPQAALRIIRELAEETAENRLYAPRARKYLASMMPALLEFLGNTPEPDFALVNFERVTASLGAKTMLFELVAEDPRALNIFGSIAAHSRWLSDILARRPGLVDEFIDELQTFTRLDRTKLALQLKERLANATDTLDALYWQRDLELLRIGLFDVCSRTPLPETLRELCALAEVILEAALADARGGGAESLAVVAMGKLGSGALDYASDLDLVFVYDPDEFVDATQAQAQSARRVRALTDLLSTPRDRGRLYEVDLRLRPRGKASSLAVSTAELERYFSNEAGFWERLATCRARVLFDEGSETGDRVRRILRDFCYLGGADAVATRSMRSRIEANALANDLKRAEGGLLDVEFLLAHLQLAHGKEIEALRQPGVFEALEAARDAGLIDAPAHDELLGAYAFLRQVVNRMRILDGRPHDELPEGDALEVLARRVGYSAGGTLSAAQQLMEELDWHRKTTRRAFERYVV